MRRLLSCTLITRASCSIGGVSRTISPATAAAPSMVRSFASNDASSSSSSSSSTATSTGTGTSTTGAPLIGITNTDVIPSRSPRSPTYRAYNFSAGPACLPSNVMARAQREFTNWGGTGMGMMEMSHRDAGGPVQRSIVRAEELFRQLLKVPDDYHVLFFQGGAHAQFAAVPLNILGDKKSASYGNSGFWSQRAANEAKKYVTINSAFDCTTNNFKTLPDVKDWKVSANDAYVHICANETIHGLEFLTDPAYTSKPPLVIDMTSTLLSRAVDISKYGIVYASGGKNLGPAGVVVVIVKKSLVSPSLQHSMIPSVLSYSAMATSTPIPNIYNTPPTFLLYMMSLVLEDLQHRGGVVAMEQRAIKHSKRLYDIIDGSKGFYGNTVDPKYRSRMNVPFRVAGGDAALEKEFTMAAERDGLLQVFGHPLFGGQRITLYNGVPDGAVDSVAEYMIRFQQKHGTSAV